MGNVTAVSGLGGQLSGEDIDCDGSYVLKEQTSYIPVWHMKPSQSDFKFPFQILSS